MSTLNSKLYLDNNLEKFIIEASNIEISSNVLTINKDISVSKNIYLDENSQIYINGSSGEEGFLIEKDNYGKLVWSNNISTIISQELSLNNLTVSGNAVFKTRPFQDLCGYLALAKDCAPNISGYEFVIPRNIFQDASLNNVTINGDLSLNNVTISGDLSFNQNILKKISFITTNTIVYTNTIPSDDRLKHNEKSIENGLEVIRQLNPQFYQKTETFKTHDFSGILTEPYILEAGFIAQEVEDISDLSFTVFRGDISTPYRLNYNNIFTYSFSAIKQLDNKIADEDLKLENIANTLNTNTNNINNNIVAINNINNELLNINALLNNIKI